MTTTECGATTNGAAVLFFNVTSSNAAPAVQIGAVVAGIAVLLMTATSTYFVQ